MFLLDTQGLVYRLSTRFPREIPRLCSHLHENRTCMLDKTYLLSQHYVASVTVIVRTSSLAGSRRSESVSFRCVLGLAASSSRNSTFAKIAYLRGPDLSPMAVIKRRYASRYSRAIRSRYHHPLSRSIELRYVRSLHRVECTRVRGRESWRIRSVGERARINTDVV